MVRTRWLRTPSGESMGAVQMRGVSSLDAAAGATLTLEPGGLHVMLLELGGALESGASFERTLTFDDGSEQTVSVGVRGEV